MTTTQVSSLPVVAMWRIHLLRLLYLLMLTVMGLGVWKYLLFAPDHGSIDRMTSASLLGGLAVAAALGIRYPLQMLPLLLFELIWKTVYILVLYTPAWLAGEVTPDMQSLFQRCIGIVALYVVMPWGYVWARYFAQPSEPWRKAGS
jgi:hypothetical protein